MVSILAVCCHCLAKARVCPTAAVWGDHTGETMAKLLNELGRGEPAIPPSFTPCPFRLDVGRPDYLTHFSVSSAMSLLKSAGEPTNAVPPSSASRALILGSARPALISWLSLPMISVGVFLGAPIATNALASKPGRNS